MRSLWQDAQYAFRLTRKNPGFTAVAVLSLVLGIGANTVLFSIVYGVLLRPLPYEQPGRLMRLIRSMDQPWVTVPEFEFWKEHSKSFDSVAGYRCCGDQNLVVGAETEHLRTVRVTESFFKTLGLPLSIGRDFDSEETRTGGPNAVILTHGLWQLAFSSAHDIVGRTIVFEKTAYTVVGVLPADFWFPETADAFVPLRPSGSAEDSGTNTVMIGRLKSGVSIREAASKTTALGELFRRESTPPYRPESDYHGLTPIPFQSSLTADVRLILLVIFAAAGVVLLIACSNLASLIMARLAGREREVAVRLALGSSRARLARQFLTENLLLAATGGAGGFFLALSALPGLLSRIPFQLPAATPIRLNMPVLLFTFGVALTAGILLSLVPCVSSSRLDIHESLKNAGRTAGNTPSRYWTRTVLVTGQIALSAVLLVGAILLSESLYRLSHQDLGFDPNRLTTLRVSADSAVAGGDAGLDRVSLTNTLDRLRSLPGIQNSAAVNMLPFTGPNNYPTQRYGHPDQSIGGMEIRVVTPDYFATMGIPVQEGRVFTNEDDSGTTPVVVLSENVARRWWPNGDPLGDLVVRGLFKGQPVPKGSTPDAPRTVVGIVGNTKSVSLTERPRPTVYIPYAQTSEGISNFVIRGNLPKMFAEQLRTAAAQVDPRLRVQNVRMMEDVTASITADSRFNALLFGMFAGTAVLLASIGIFGLLSFSVIQRTREIGTRLALGASRVQVLSLVLRQGLVMLAAGLASGIAAALGLSRFISQLLFGVQANNIPSYFAAGVVLLLVGILASYLPARRAMKIDPMTALRNE